MIEKVRQRYNSYNFSGLISFRITELDAQFADLQVKEQQWPLPGPDVMPMYKNIRGEVQQLRIAGVPVWSSEQSSWIVPRV
jgi:hypothetical protein